MSTSRLKVTIIGINYAPEVTGIAPYTTGLAERLVRDGYEVRVVTSMPHYPAWRILPEHVDLPNVDTVSGVELRRLRHHIPTESGMLGRLRMELGFAFRAVTSRWGQPDVVICVSPSLVSSAAALLKARISRKRPKTIAWVQDIYSKGVVEAVDGSGLVARATVVGESAILRLADRVVVIHDRFKRTATDYLGVPEDRVEVVRNWTHVSAPSKVPDTDQRLRFGWSQDETIVLHAGNMGAKQGLDNVVETARIADETAAPVRFVLLGDGNQRRRLEALGSGISCLQFLDPLDDKDFAIALSCADILLLNEKPEVTEMAVPSKLTTYFAAAKPVVAATNFDSTSAEEIRVSGGGVIVPAGSPDRLLSEILALRNDRERAAELGSSGRRYQLTTLTSQACLDRLSKCIGGDDTRYTEDAHAV